MATVSVVGIFFIDAVYKVGCYRACSGLLTSVEVKALEGKGSQAMILWLWIGSLLQRAFAERLLLADIKVLMKLYSNVQEARNSIQKVGTFINVQLPLPYVHVIICITKLVFLMLTFQVCNMHSAFSTYSCITPFTVFLPTTQ